MKLIKYDHYGVIVLEPDDPEELRADEPDHDDAEADPPKPRITFALRVECAEMERALDRYAREVGNLVSTFEGETR